MTEAAVALATVRDWELALAPSGDPRALLEQLIAEAKERSQVNGGADSGWWGSVSAALMSTDCTSEAKLRLELHFLCLIALRIHEELSLGLELGERAVSLAQRSGERALLRRAHSLLGTLHSRGSREDLALIEYVNALTVSEEIGDRRGYCSSLANLAGILMNLGMLEDAIVIGEQVVTLGVELGMHVERVLAHQVTAIAAMRRRDYVLALNHIEMAVTVSTEPTTQEAAYQRCMIEHTYVAILGSMGKIWEAQQHATACKLYADMSQNAKASAQASVAQVLVGIHQGDKVAIYERVIDSELGKAQPNKRFLRDLIEAAIAVYEKKNQPVQVSNYRRILLAQESKWRRETAEQQLAGLRGVCKPVPEVTDWLLKLLPSDLARRIEGRGLAHWKGFREQVEAVALLAQLHDDRDGMRAFRGAKLAGVVAQRMGWSTKAAHELELAARVRDIGKLLVPESVLMNREQLHPEEQNLVRSHTLEGEKMLLRLSEAPQMRLAATIARGHHEWWNGSGFPDGRTGAETPEAAQIVAIADVFDALVHPRSYQKAWTVEFALEKIRVLAGKQFDPKLAEVFIATVRDLHERLGSGMDEFLGSEATKAPLLSAQRVVDRILSMRKPPPAPNNEQVGAA